VIGAAQDVEACCELLTQALEREPLSLPLLLALATQLLNQQQLEAAAQLIRRALKLNPHARPAWLLLARCCVLQRCFASALIALNVMPSAPMPQGDLQQLQLQDLPQAASHTQPQVRAEGLGSGLDCAE
jgi:predicted Zn-dependent protease